MPDVYSIAEKKDKGGRRSGIDRRKLFIAEYTPDRRSNEGRRSSQDRRNGRSLAEISNPKRGTDRYVEFVNTQKGVLVAILLSFPIWALIIFMIINRVHP
jgi:hypothetical protein